MDAGRRTTTADYATMFRAAHLRFDDRPSIFEDPIAFDILDPAFRGFLRFPLAFRFVQALWPLRSARTQILVRSRYAEDRLAEAIRRGVRQYVILGAGFDTYALRRPSSDPPLAIFELDLEENQDAKRDRLRDLGQPPPACVRYAPIDFETGSVREVLRDACFDEGQPAFFSWLGVVHYLTRPSVARTLRQIADCAADGSELVFDYRLDAPLSGSGEKERRQVTLATQTRGEAMHAAFGPEEIAGFAERNGWSLLEDLSPKEQRRRYLAGRADRLDVFEMFALAAFVRAPRSASGRASASWTDRRP